MMNNERDDGLPSPVTDKAQRSPSGPTGGFTVTWGDKDLAKPAGLQAISSTKDRAVRFSIVPGFNPVAAYTHFLEGAGSGKGATYLCQESEDPSGCVACARGIRRDLRVLAVVAHYENANAQGALPVELTPEISIKYVKLSRANYAAVGDLIPEDGALSDVDIVMFNQPSRIGYQFKSAPSRIKQHRLEDKVNAMAKAALPDPTALNKRLGKKVTPAEMRAAILGPAEMVETADLSNIEGI
jgi:hypothetical protein